MTTEMQQFWETRDRLMRTGSVERMETFLTQWQQKMETKGNFLDWASVTNEKGLFYRKIGLFEESISVMESLRKALLKERGRHSPEYASLLNNLGGTYRKMGDKDTAIALFEESLAIFGHPQFLALIDVRRALQQEIHQRDGLRRPGPVVHRIAIHIDCAGQIVIFHEQRVPGFAGQLFLPLRQCMGQFRHR